MLPGEIVKRSVTREQNVQDSHSYITN